MEIGDVLHDDLGLTRVEVEHLERRLRRRLATGKPSVGETSLYRDRCEQRLPLDPLDLLIDPIRHRKRLHAIFDPLDVDDERCLLRRFCVARTAATHLRFSILLLLLLRRLRNERKRRRQILS